MNTTTTKEEIIAQFDPSGPGIAGNLFGLPFSPDNSEMIIIPVPWEVTVSYHAGTSGGPQAILNASSQLDLYTKDIPDAWKLGVSMLPVARELAAENAKLRQLTAMHIGRLEKGEVFDPEDPLLKSVNDACENLNIYVKALAQKYLKEGKMVGMVGGEHSVPLGYLRALSERHERFGILQIDAHADLRKSYEGFTYSHASIMYNALKLPAVGRLVQVGIRDYAHDEVSLMKRAMGRIVTFLDEEIKDRLYNGKTWDFICDEIIGQLPKEVYISFDIDGLDPKLCPNTGTPVAGGLEFQQAVHLIRKVALSGRKIIGFDLCEVAAGANDFDANVGARILYQLCNWTAVSQGRLRGPKR